MIVDGVTNIDPPEFFNRIEGDDLLEQIIPVIALRFMSARIPRLAAVECGHTLPLGGLVNHNVHLFCSGCLTLKLSLSWKTVTGVPPSFASASTPPPGETGMVERSTCLSMSVAIFGDLRRDVERKIQEGGRVMPKMPHVRREEWIGWAVPKGVGGKGARLGRGGR